jgi:uncharacterized protein YceK
MSERQFTAQELLVIMDVTLTASECGKILHHCASAIRYHRQKMGIRYAKYKNYGFIKKMLKKKDCHDKILSLYIKEIADEYNVHIATASELRRAIRETK